MRNEKYFAVVLGYHFMSTKKSGSGPRELIDTGRNKVYARRDAAGCRRAGDARHVSP